MSSFRFRSLFAGLVAASLVASPFLGMAAEPSKAGGNAYLGISAQHEATDAGVTIHAVSPDSPAGKAGLHEGDRIVKAGDKEVKSFDDLKSVLAGHKPGDDLNFEVMRDGKKQSLTVKLGEAPVRAEAKESAPAATSYLGVQAQTLTPELKEHLELKADKGALVTDVLPNSPASKAGLESEDVITHVDATAITTPQELREAVQKAGAGKEVTLKVVRGKKEMELKAHLEAIPEGKVGAAGRMPQLPEGFEPFSGHLHHFFSEMEKVPALEKKIQELENRVRELERKSTR